MFPVDDAPSDSEDVVSCLSAYSFLWYSNLTSHKYKPGDPRVTFDELWPDVTQLSGLLSCLKENGDVLLAFCKLGLRLGPVKILKALLDNKMIDPNHTFTSGRSLHHIACLASNVKSVEFLSSCGISLTAVDKQGFTPNQLCFCSNTHKTQLQVHKKKAPSHEDVQRIFEHIYDSESFDDLQMSLHMFTFDVNKERDSEGDLVLHRAVRQGLSHLALIVNLVQVHKADVESTDNQGMTPLCIAAHLGYAVIAEVLICILGADPSSHCHLSCWTPLHFAVKQNSLSLIECLIRREADLNAEDRFGYRADDIAQKLGNQDCQKLIESQRYQRCQRLSSLAKKGNLTPQMIYQTDMFTVDDDGYTLLMVAAVANRCDNLMVLLHKGGCPVNAQDTENGQTALSLAAMCGKSDAVQTLLRYGAHPRIGDIQGMLPLHHACVNEHVLCVQMIVNTVKGLTGLAKALKCTSNPEILGIVQEAMVRRQKNVVNPTLFECAMNGDANHLYCTLEEGDDVNPLTGTGDWPLYLAVGNRHLEVTTLLHLNGGDIWRQHETTGSTVLHVASSRGLYDIVSYILRVWDSGTSSPAADLSDCELSEHGTLDINAVNYTSQTALQVAAVKGFSQIVKLLLHHGASSALTDSKGQLYKCSEYEGVQVLIENHQRSRAERIMSLIKRRGGELELRRIWQAKFDHNLRNHSGDTPLMAACLHGRTQVVKFLLQSAIQNTAENKTMPRRKERSGCLSDSGAFDESQSEWQCTKSIVLLPVEEEGADVSDFDQDAEAYEVTPTRKHSSEHKCFSSSVQLQRTLSMRSDLTGSHKFSESLNALSEISEADQAMLEKRKFFSMNDIKEWQSEGDHTTSKQEMFLHSSPLKTFQGTCVNHMYAVNMQDGSTLMHRAVECLQEQQGLECLVQLLEKDSSIINTQNFQGLSPLHLAAKLKRKRAVKALLSHKAVDLNLRTACGKLAADVARSRSIRHLIQDAHKSAVKQRLSEVTVTSGLPVPETSIDFDKLDERFKQLSKTNYK